MSDNGLNRIVPGVAPMMGVNLEVIADVDPEKFPNGMEVTFTVPGGLGILGRGVARKGCMVAILPPEMANPAREAMKHAISKQRAAGPGEIKAPGL